MLALTIRRHDTRRAVKVLRNPSGSLVDLTGAEVKFIMTKNGRLLINWATDIIEAKNGVVCFAFERGEVMELCIMKAEFEVTYLYFSIESFPIDRFITIEIVADLA